MINSLATAEINPFEDNVVRAPRDVSFSVAGLNDAPLKALLRTFAALEGSVPRDRPANADKAQLVVSPDRGYGKSHLLGRFFKELGRRATKVYLRPFQDPSRPWHSILLLTVQELDCAEEESMHAPTQLEAMALGTLAHVIADFANDISLPPDASAAVGKLRALASASLEIPEQRRLTKWLAGLCADSATLARLSYQIKRKRDIDLHGREKAWLNVFAAIAFDEPYSEKRAAAMKWLRAEPLESGEIIALNMAVADDDARGDASAQDVNSISFSRLRGFCLLASYYRPFVFCFDQTEFFASDRSLIVALGNCVDQLFTDLHNHMTVITANQENWMTEIIPHINPAQQNRIASELKLEGIDIAGAQGLITERLYICGLGGETERFFANRWLEELFEIVPSLGVRFVLTQAADRFRDLAKRPKQTLSDLFEIEMNGVRTKKALMAYNQDALMWFVQDIGRGLEGVSFTRPEGRRYWSFELSWSDRRAAFAFENGVQWKRWKAIAAESIKLARANGARRSLSYVFRSPDLPKVPSTSWVVAKSTIDEAKHHGFDIIDLTQDQVCEIHAARELYSNSLQGNIDHSAAETLAWLQTRFNSFLSELSSRIVPDRPIVVPPVEEEPPQTRAAELDEDKLQVLLRIVRQERVVDIAIVLARLGSEDLRDPLLRSVETHPNLKAHPGPRTIFLQWRHIP